KSRTLPPRDVGARRYSHHSRKHAERLGCQRERHIPHLEPVTISFEQCGERIGTRSGGNRDKKPFSGPRHAVGKYRLGAQGGDGVRLSLRPTLLRQPRRRRGEPTDPLSQRETSGGEESE